MNQMQGTSRSSYAAVGADLKRVQSTEGVTWQYVILAIATTGSNIYVAEICQLGLFYIGAQQRGVSPQFLIELNIGFVDVLELVKSMSCKLPGIDNFKQRTVYNYLFNDPQDKRHIHDVHRDKRYEFNKRKWEDNRCNRMSKRRINSQTNTPKSAASRRNYNYDVIKKHKAKGQPKFKEQMRKISKATSKTLTEHFRSEPHMYNIIAS